MKNIIDQLTNIVGSDNIVPEENYEQYTTEIRRFFSSNPLAIVLPKNKDIVIDLVKFCRNNGISIVPQGGHTGTVGGAIANKKQIIINFAHMNNILDVNIIDNVITVEAGCTLQKIKDCAEQHNRFFPLSLASAAKCQIGGNLATNAGGLNVLHYGNTRELCLGLEIVTAKAELCSSLRMLKKDNAGYDLKNLFIGSEGTLGLITAATLKLYPKPFTKISFICGFNDIKKIIDLFNFANEKLNYFLTAFEFMSHFGMQITQHYNQIDNKLISDHSWYVFCELSNNCDYINLHEVVTSFIAEAQNHSIIVKHSVIIDEVDQNTIWKLRKTMSPAQNRFHAALKHDVSVPIFCIAKFVNQVIKQVKEIAPDIIPNPFGHIGDGNVHFNFIKPDHMSSEDFFSYQDKVRELVFNNTHFFAGSIAAEHGIGRTRVNDLIKYKNNVELEMILDIKKVFDNQNVFNPDVMLQKR